MITFLAVLIRILSNSMSNVFQKQLTQEAIKPYVINFLTYLGLSLFCLPLAIGHDFSFGIDVWQNAILGGLCGALGNNYLIKALEEGELSVLGPINAYKSVVAMIIGIFLLKEIPSLTGLLAVALIIWGSYYVFDAAGENFSFSLLKKTAIRYRIYALVFTAIEAVFIKNIVLHSDVEIAFYFWCWFGAAFSFLNVIKHREKLPHFSVNTLSKLAALIGCVGVMQYSTNFVFNRINVSYALALFQLSAVLSVILGWKYFSEHNIRKKLTGSIIMVIGAIILIILK